MQLLGGFVQADKSAKSYLEYSSFSRQGLIDQLKYEGFSQSQAEYGVSCLPVLMFTPPRIDAGRDH